LCAVPVGIRPARVVALAVRGLIRVSILLKYIIPLNGATNSFFSRVVKLRRYPIGSFLL